MWYRNDQDLFELKPIEVFRIEWVVCPVIATHAGMLWRLVANEWAIVSTQPPRWRSGTCPGRIWLLRALITFLWQTSLTWKKKFFLIREKLFIIIIIKLWIFLSFLVRILAIFVNRPTLSLKTSTSAGRPTSSAAPRGRYCYEDQFNFAYKLNTGGSDESVERILLSTKTHVTQNFYRKC